MKSERFTFILVPDNDGANKNFQSPAQTFFDCYLFLSLWLLLFSVS